MRPMTLRQARAALRGSFHLVKRHRSGPTLRLCRVLLRDPHDLIHKACGRKLREVGKRDRQLLERFLDAHYARMPRTMLRYALERLPDARRRAYLRDGPARLRAGGAVSAPKRRGGPPRVDRATPGGMP